MDAADLILLNIVGSSISSSSDDESNECDQGVPMSHTSSSAYLIACALTEDHSRQRDYLKIIGLYSDLDFWRHFRVTRSSFTLILDFLKSIDFPSDVCFHGGNYPMDIEKMINLSLEYLVNQGAIRLVAIKFGRSESTGI